MTTRDTWKKRVAEWRASGLSSAEFAAGRGFTGSGLRHMAHRLRSEPEVRLARVEVVAERVPSEAPVVVRAGAGGVRIEVTRGFSREVLAAVLNVVEGRLR